MKSLAEKIEVMQAALDGKEIEYSAEHTDGWYSLTIDSGDDIGWAWNIFDYRIKKEPMEFWISIFDTGSTVISPTYSEAPAHAKTIKVREVTDE